MSLLKEIEKIEREWHRRQPIDSPEALWVAVKDAARAIDEQRAALEAREKRYEEKVSPNGRLATAIEALRGQARHLMIRRLVWTEQGGWTVEAS